MGEPPSGEAGERVDIQATLRNPLDREAIYELVWTLPDGEVVEQQHEVPAMGTATAATSIAIPAQAPGEELASVRLAYQLLDSPIQGEQRLAVKAVREIPTGEPASREPDFAMLGEADVYNAHGADPTRQHMTWQGPSDLSAKVWLAMGDDSLRVVIETRDDNHVQQQDPQGMWKQDSVQLGLQVPGQQGFWKLGFAHNAQGQPMVTHWQRPVGFTAIDDAIALDTNRQGGMTRYEADIALDRIGLTTQRLHQGFSIGLIVNDDDGDGREGWVELSPGMGKNDDPSRYLAVRFASEKQ
jgi:hypothetical protein